MSQEVYYADWGNDVDLLGAPRRIFKVGRIIYTTTYNIKKATYVIYDSKQEDSFKTSIKDSSDVFTHEEHLISKELRVFLRTL
jgi:hypothetical protein